MLLPRCIRIAVLAFSLPLISAITHAQIAVYANFEGSRLDQNSTWLKGGTFGLYDDFIKLGPLHLGADARGSILKGDNSLQVSKALFGLRVAIKPPVLPFKPYAELLGGGQKEDTAPLKGNWTGAYEVNGGADLTFLPHLDWRVVELGGGNFNDQVKKNFHVSTGLVLRFF